MRSGLQIRPAICNGLQIRLACVCTGSFHECNRTISPESTEQFQGILKFLAEFKKTSRNVFVRFSEKLPDFNIPAIFL